MAEVTAAAAAAAAPYSNFEPGTERVFFDEAVQASEQDRASRDGKFRHLDGSLRSDALKFRVVDPELFDRLFPQVAQNAPQEQSDKPEHGEKSGREINPLKHVRYKRLSNGVIVFGGSAQKKRRPKLTAPASKDRDVLVRLITTDGRVVVERMKKSQVEREVAEERRSFLKSHPECVQCFRGKKRN